MVKTLALLALASFVTAQQIGPGAENHPRLTTKKCTLKGGCKTQQTSVVLESTSHPLKDIRTGKSCYKNGALDPSICSTAQECADRCALGGVNYAKNGVKTSGNSLHLRQYLGTAPDIKTVSPRVYLLDDEGQDYTMLKLLNQEFTFTVDVSGLPCGMNGALYLSAMERDGGRSNMNPAGATYGTGYCDAQCPRQAFTNGVQNVDNLGACCNEMDIWEANSASTQMTPHVCAADSLFTCSGSQCPQCDTAGCGYNTYAVGDHSFYGRNSSHTVDTTKTMKVVTQFITSNNKVSGNLTEIRRLYVQNGKVIQNGAFTFNGAQVNSITQPYCSDYASWNTAFEEYGAMAHMGEQLAKGMVLIFSIWNTNYGNMSWLDTGNAGPCDVTQDSADQIEAEDPTTYVTFSDIRWGDIGSTY